MKFLQKRKPEDLMVTRMAEAAESRAKTQAERIPLRPVRLSFCGLAFPHKPHVFYAHVNGGEAPNNCDGSVVR